MTNNSRIHKWLRGINTRDIDRGKGFLSQKLLMNRELKR